MTKKKKVEAKRKTAKKGGVGSGILKKPTDNNGCMWKREKKLVSRERGRGAKERENV